MFQVSRRVDYAVRLMIALSQMPEGTRQTTRILAKRTGISKPFLHKIAADLVKADLVNTYAGPTGGLELARRPEDITMRHIIEAIERPIVLDPCTVKPETCRELAQQVHSYWETLQDAIVQQLDATPLTALGEGAF
ncbi:MAG: Rrf2 family transcriptional regulator [Anaerolineales bacterium]|nr:Rrf2 family transcriptional regulator [Anaerolineales bacterium]